MTRRGIVLDGEVPTPRGRETATIPAGTLGDGRTVRIAAYGRMEVPVADPPEPTLMDAVCANCDRRYGVHRGLRCWPPSRGTYWLASGRTRKGRVNPLTGGVE